MKAPDWDGFIWKMIRKHLTPETEFYIKQELDGAVHQENLAWLRGERCTNCGREREPDPLAEMCSNCYQDA